MVRGTRDIREDPTLPGLKASTATPKGVVFKKPETGLFSKYPIDRGALGWTAYHFSVGVSRILIRLRAEGRENIPAKPPYVLCPNHETYFDGMWAAAFLPKGHFKHFCSLAAQELMSRHGTLGQLMLRVGRGIPVDRLGNPVRALILAKQQLEKGELVMVHPEGTRSPDGEFGEFKDGAAYLSMKSGAPIVPVYIEGGYQVINRHMRWPRTFDWKRLRRMTVTLTFGKPMLPCDYKDSKEMTQRLVDWMHGMRASKRGFAPTPG